MKRPIAALDANVLFKDMIDSLRRQRANLSKPPLEVERFMENLRKQNLPKFVKAIEIYKNDL